MYITCNSMCRVENSTNILIKDVCFFFRCCCLEPSCLLPRVFKLRKPGSHSIQWPWRAHTPLRHSQLYFGKIVLNMTFLKTLISEREILKKRNFNSHDYMETIGYDNVCLLHVCLVFHVLFCLFLFFLYLIRKYN